MCGKSAANSQFREVSGQVHAQVKLHTFRQVSSQVGPALQAKYRLLDTALLSETAFHPIRKVFIGQWKEMNDDSLYPELVHQAQHGSAYNLLAAYVALMAMVGEYSDNHEGIQCSPGHEQRQKIVHTFPMLVQHLPADWEQRFNDEDDLPDDRAQDRRAANGVVVIEDDDSEDDDGCQDEEDEGESERELARVNLALMLRTTRMPSSTMPSE